MSSGPNRISVSSRTRMSIEIASVVKHPKIITKIVLKFAIMGMTCQSDTVTLQLTVTREPDWAFYTSTNEKVY